LSNPKVDNHDCGLQSLAFACFGLKVSGGSVACGFEICCSDRGALSVDEALNLVQAVLGGNSRSVGFILMPQAHSSTSHTAILKNRRLLEDKSIATLKSIKKLMQKRIARL